MCRDSAIVVASIAARLGRASIIGTGQAAFFAPIDGNQHGCLHFRTHAWTKIDGFGLCDFTPDFSPGAFPGWQGPDVAFLAGSRYQPGGTRTPEYICGDVAAFNTIVAGHHAHRPAFASVYLEEQRHVFDTMLFGGAVNFAQSPLLRDLSRQPYFSLDILAKAALHIWRVIKGDSASLRRYSQDTAWAAIGAIDSAVAEKFRLRLRLADAAL
jgi:hypothetical protein